LLTGCWQECPNHYSGSGVTAPAFYSKVSAFYSKVSPQIGYRGILQLSWSKWNALSSLMWSHSLCPFLLSAFHVLFPLTSKEPAIHVVEDSSSYLWSQTLHIHIALRREKRVFGKQHIFCKSNIFDNSSPTSCASQVLRLT